MPGSSKLDQVDRRYPGSLVGKVVRTTWRGAREEGLLLLEDARVFQRQGGYWTAAAGPDGGRGPPGGIRKRGGIVEVWK